MKNKFSIAVGKSVRKIAKIKGGGSALPGLVVEKINPKLVNDILSKLPHGVVVVSGTNGKTTTTKIVVELLESHGLKVFTNKTGSNFVRGVVSSLIESIDLNGNLEADIAVLELDEAHAVHFVNRIKPKYSLILNVLRDQLDRFGEIDTTAKMLQKIAISTTQSVILNINDDHLGSQGFQKPITAKITTFGFDKKLSEYFITDSQTHNKKTELASSNNSDVVLQDFKNQLATIQWNGINHQINFKINGIYNILNAAAAVALVEQIMKNESIKISDQKIIKTLENVEPAFGRGETIEVKGTPIELVLVKNPSGFRLGLKSFRAENRDVMIAINDNYADGRDMSWLWDVDFGNLNQSGVAKITGTRAYDMALRLFHDDINFDETNINTDIAESLTDFIHSSTKPKLIFCTYTAMLEIREELSKITKVEKIL